MLPHLTMVVAGHVDAGKSTLVGNLLHQIGLVNTRQIRKFEMNAQVRSSWEGGLCVCCIVCMSMCFP